MIISPCLVFDDRISIPEPPGLVNRKRSLIRPFRPVWLLITLSFLFYIPVAVGAGIVPILGMLMLPKTICYILLILAFLRVCAREESGTGGR